VTAEGLESASEGGLPRTQALFTARVDARTHARVGADIDLAVDVRQCHFFDPQTGARLVPQGAPELVAR
jgi:multiple sugar transport system ATP-binding protein